MFNQYRRATGAQHAVSERCHLKPHRYGLRDPAQLADLLQLAHEVAQITVFHICNCSLLIVFKCLTGYYEAF